MRIFKILLILLILIFIYYFIKPKRHDFWDKQLVNRSNINNNKMISEPIKIKIDKKLINENWKKADLKKLIKFINKNYNDDQIYQKKYFNWILKSPHNHIQNLDNVDRNNFNVCLVKNNNILGSITGRPIVLSINNKIKRALYVDLLCVHKKFRNKRYAPKLISKMIELIKTYDIELAIFNIDQKQLPFNHIGSIQYYYIKLIDIVQDQNKSINISELNKNNCSDAFEYYNNIIKTNKLFQLINLDEFIYYFKPRNDLVKTFIAKDINNKIIGFSSFIITYYRYNNEILKNIELINYFYSRNNYDFFEELIKIFKKYEFRYIIIPNNYTYQKLIDRYNLSKCQKTYYYFYNYNLKLDVKDICLNFP